jgi:hypothetical protein
MGLPIAPSRFDQRAIRGDEFVPIAAVGSSRSWRNACTVRACISPCEEMYFGTVDEWLTLSRPP